MPILLIYHLRKLLVLFRRSRWRSVSALQRTVFWRLLEPNCRFLAPRLQTATHSFIHVGSGTDPRYRYSSCCCSSCRGVAFQKA